MAGKNCFVYISVALFFAFNGSFAVYRAFFSKNTFSFKEFLMGILFFCRWDMFNGFSLAQGKNESPARFSF